MENGSSPLLVSHLIGDFPPYLGWVLSQRKWNPQKEERVAQMKKMIRQEYSIWLVVWICYERLQKYIFIWSMTYRFWILILLLSLKKLLHFLLLSIFSIFIVFTVKWIKVYDVYLTWEKFEYFKDTSSKTDFIYRNFLISNLL